MLAELIGNSHAVVALREEVGRLLQRPLGGRSLPPILIEGETGTGKGLLASAIHRAGPRRAGPFVAINCAAIPETLLEAELFGFERGAFTDARQAKPGLVETAHGGTLFLDEIGLLPGILQGKFLTVLEEGAVRRLGRTRSDPVDVAILAATSEDLRRAVREHRFSEALYHRLSVLVLRLPPLRERGADIVLLAEHWLARSAADYGVPVKALSPEARAALRAYPWPGNVRELRNLIERVTLVGQLGLVTPGMLGLATGLPGEQRDAVRSPDASRLRERLTSMERETLVDVMNETAWNITRAAARLSVPPTTLRYRLRKYGLLAGFPAPANPRELWERAPEPGPPPADAAVPNVPEISATPPTAPDATGAPPPLPSIPRPIAEAGRRQLTVMLCGLAHSGGLSRLDPDELHEAIRDAQDACADVIGRFEGHVAPYLGDGLLVYFGFPLAHEDAARRAVHAALGIVETIRKFSSRLERERGVRVTARLGIHTGVVVVLGDLGRGGRGEHVAVGETPLVALQLQEIAASDTVAISPATYRLVEGYFVCEALGRHPLPALAEPLAIYRVIRESAARGRLDAVSAGFTPLVGRQQEVGLLLERWEQAKEGRGQVVLVSGEAGIGKSRLVQVLDERIAGEPHTRLAYYGSPYHQNTAFYPVVDHVQRRLQFDREESPQEKLAKVEAALVAAGLGTEEALALVAALLSLPLPERHGPLSGTPQWVKRKTLDVLLAWLLADAESEVTLSVWEDLQWVDPSTLEFLDRLVEEAPTARLLLLLTFRHDFAHPWPPRSHLTHVSPHRLSRGQAAVMVENVAKGRAMPAAVVQQLVARTDGVPLFVEELTKMVLESRLLPETSDDDAVAGPATPLAIPSTLHDSLMARLDRLGSGKEAVQLAATLGREFSYDVIHAVSPMDEAALQRELARLVDAELLYRKGSPPQARYSFRHALIQDAAYQSLLPSRKREYHARVAHVLEERLGREIDPELLAHHYTEAGLTREAIAYWHRAGQRAMDRCAITEAIGHVSKGLALLETLPDTGDRSSQELTLQLTLGAALLTIKDYTAPDVEKVHARARELRHHVGDSPQLFSALFGLWRFHLSRAELPQAHELGQECFALARRLDDRALLLQAHFARGLSSLNLGEFASALTDLEQAMALHDPEQPSGLAFLSGIDPVVACRCYAARALWFLGYPDQALASSQEALNLAHRASHAATLGYAIHVAGALHTYRREVHVVQQLAEMAITLANKHGFERWRGAGLLRRGWALMEQGGAEDGIAYMRQGLDTWGPQLGRSHFLALLATAHGNAGQIDAGLLVLDEALTIAQGKSERFYEAELHRIKGELLLQRDAASRDPLVPSHEPSTPGAAALPPSPVSDGAELCFREAIGIARRQGAKSLELRAVTSLSRLWRGQGKRAEARHMLAEIHSWFTEGLDTPDLREARAQLEALT